MENTMVQNIQHNPQDLTGRKKAELAAQYAEEQQAAAARMSTITAQAEQKRTETVDVSGDDTRTVNDVEVRVPKVEMRVNTPLENVTIGHGNNYDFEVGQKYRVTKDVYDYLDDLGFVWH